MGKKTFSQKKVNIFKGESNPFNVKFNRSKHLVLGSNVKGSKGLPNTSKGISFAKRKEMLQKSLVAKQKSNRYFDKRQMDPNVSFEDHVTARFVKERQKKGKKSIFNLNDEELTHEGKPLSELETYADGVNSDDEDDLKESFINKAHFGGFASESNFETPKTHKEIIEDMIAESKQRKMEKKMEKEKYISNQEEVDKLWREIHFMGSKTNLTDSKKLIKKTSDTKDPYDVSKNELKFEPKSSSITHTKTPEELMREEQKRIEKLTAEKLSRMTDNKPLNTSKSINHLSADAICNEYEYLQVPIEETNDKLSSKSDEDSDSDESVISNYSLEETNQDEIESKLSDGQKSSFNEGDLTLSDLPTDISTFQNLIKDCDSEQLHKVISNILKKPVKSRNEKILTKLENFFKVLLQYAVECCEKKYSNIELVSVFTPHLHSIAVAAPFGTAIKFLEFLDKEQQIFQLYKKQSNKRKSPRVQTLIILNFACLVYSVSDFRHPVVTPAMLLMSDILSAKFCFSFLNILSRLMVSKLVLHCIADSKRFVPESVNFLKKILCLAIPEKIISKNDSQQKQFNLIITEKVLSESIPHLNIFNLNKDLTIEEKKMGIISAVINQLLQFTILYTHLPSFKQIFEPVSDICLQLPIHLYPTTLEISVKKLIDLKQKSITLNQLSFEAIKPKPLKMFEPSFESKFDQKDDVNRKRKLVKRVEQKIRKEEKSMLREIRRDAQVIASEKLKEKLESDAERKRKVKEIFGELAMQEGEFKKMKKK